MIAASEAEKVRAAVQAAEALEALESVWSPGDGYPLGVDLPELSELAWQVRRLAAALSVALCGES